MCYGAEAAWIPAMMAAIQGTATAAGAGTAAAGTTAALGAGAVGAGAAGAGLGAAAGLTAAEIAAAEAAAAAAAATEGGLLAGAAAEGGGGLLAGEGLGAAQNMTMESAMADTGYTPSNLKFAFQNSGDTINAAGEAGMNRPLSQNLANYGRGMMTRAGNGAMLNNMMAGSASGAGGQLAMKMGMDMMNPQQPQQAPSPPPQQQGPQQPLSMPYTNSLQGPPPGMTREEWEKLKRQRGLLGGM